jgi:hypothetical protein
MQTGVDEERRALQVAQEQRTAANTELKRYSEQATLARTGGMHTMLQVLTHSRLQAGIVTASSCMHALGHDAPRATGIAADYPPVESRCS